MVFRSLFYQPARETTLIHIRAGGVRLLVGGLSFQAMQELSGVKSGVLAANVQMRRSHGLDGATASFVQEMSRERRP